MREALANSLLMHGQVPFAMVSLLDHVRKRDLPPELRCRQVRLNGTRSCALRLHRPEVFSSHWSGCYLQTPRPSFCLIENLDSFAGLSYVGFALNKSVVRLY